MAPLANHLEGPGSPVTRLSCRSLISWLVKELLSVKIRASLAPFSKTNCWWESDQLAINLFDRGLLPSVRVLLFFALLFTVSPPHAKEFSQLSKPCQHLALGAPVPNRSSKAGRLVFFTCGNRVRFNLQVRQETRALTTSVFFIQVVDPLQEVKQLL